MAFKTLYFSTWHIEKSIVELHTYNNDLKLSYWLNVCKSNVSQWSSLIGSRKEIKIKIIYLKYFFVDINQTFFNLIEFNINKKINAQTIEIYSCNKCRYLLG